MKLSCNIKETWDGIKTITTLKAKAKASPNSLTHDANKEIFG